MFDFIYPKDEIAPDWNDEKRRWMGICEQVAAHWYFLMTMEEFTALFNLRYPEEPGIILDISDPGNFNCYGFRIHLSL